MQGGTAPFPHRPSLGSRHARDLIAAAQPPIISLDHIFPLRLGDGIDIVLPVIGKDMVRTMLIEPAQIPVPAKKDATQHQPQDPLGICLGIGQAQCAPPGAPEQHPALDPQVLT